MSKLTLTFEELRQANDARKFAGKAFQACSDWNEMDWMVALMGEVGELANLLKKRRRNDELTDEQVSEIGQELADIQVYLDILSTHLGYDLAFETMVKFNRVSQKIGLDIRLHGQRVED